MLESYEFEEPLHLKSLNKLGICFVWMLFFRYGEVKKNYVLLYNKSKVA